MNILLKLILASLLASVALTGSKAETYGNARLTYKRAFHPDPALFSVVDGDTVKYRGTNYRLLGYDTPELHVACEHDRGQAAKVRLQELTRDPPNHVLLRVSRTRDKYGRPLAKLLSGGKDVAQILIGQGLAQPYDGNGPRKPWTGC